MSRGQQRSDKKHSANQNRRKTMGQDNINEPWGGQKPIITGPIGQVKYGSVVSQKMNEFERGILHNRSGEVVTRRNQALNIAREDARRRGARNVPKEGKAEKTKRVA